MNPYPVCKTVYNTPFFPPFNRGMGKTENRIPPRRVRFFTRSLERNLLWRIVNVFKPATAKRGGHYFNLSLNVGHKIGHRDERSTTGGNGL